MYVCMYVLTVKIICMEFKLFHCIITGGDDYEPESAVSLIPTPTPYEIRIIDDNTFEANESFILTIDPSSLPNRVLIQPDCMLMVTIVDNDRKLLHYYIRRSLGIATHYVTVKPANQDT